MSLIQEGDYTYYDLGGLPYYIDSISNTAVPPQGNTLPDTEADIYKGVLKHRAHIPEDIQQEERPLEFDPNMPPITQAVDILSNKIANGELTPGSHTVHIDRTPEGEVYETHPLYADTCVIFAPSEADTAKLEKATAAKARLEKELEGCLGISPQQKRRRKELQRAIYARENTIRYIVEANTTEIQSKVPPLPPPNPIQPEQEPDGPDIIDRLVERHPSVGRIGLAGFAALIPSTSIAPIADYLTIDLKRPAEVQTIQGNQAGQPTIQENNGKQQERQQNLDVSSDNIDISKSNNMDMAYIPVPISTPTPQDIAGNIKLINQQQEEDAPIPVSDISDRSDMQAPAQETKVPTAESTPSPTPTDGTVSGTFAHLIYLPFVVDSSKEEKPTPIITPGTSPTEPIPTVSSTPTYIPTPTATLTPTPETPIPPENITIGKDEPVAEFLDPETIWGERKDYTTQSSFPYTGTCEGDFNPISVNNSLLWTANSLKPEQTKPCEIDDIPWRREQIVDPEYPVVLSAGSNGERVDLIDNAQIVYPDQQAIFYFENPLKKFYLR